MDFFKKKKRTPDLTRQKLLTRSDQVLYKTTSRVFLDTRTKSLHCFILSMRCYIATLLQHEVYTFWTSQALQFYMWNSVWLILPK